MIRRLRALVGRLLPPALRGRIRTYRLRALLRRFKPRTVRHNYGGHELLIHLPDPLAEGWYDHDWPVLIEIEFLRQHGLRPGATVFDLGAHQGIVALMLAREVGPTGRVVAVEANPHNADAAATNARLNGVEHLTVRRAAIAETAGTIRFNEGLNGQVDDGTGAWGVSQAPAVTIDALAREFGPPDVLFIDVEGFECQALRGARETLTSRRPSCFVEVHLGCGLEKFGSLAELLAFFPPDRYKSYFLPADENNVRPVELSQDQLHALQVRFFLLAVAHE